MWVCKTCHRINTIVPDYYDVEYDQNGKMVHGLHSYKCLDCDADEWKLEDIAEWEEE